MKQPFRSVSFWQSALTTLPDDTFFNLLRSVLGKVKTPFNKQNLLEELSRFLVRPEILETIDAYIDDNDRRVIAAVALLSEPVPGELESFFSGEYSYAELQSILLNLEERLIIYRFRDNGVLKIALNPRLENILAPYAANTGILFPEADPELVEVINKDEKAKKKILDSRILAAVFAFLFNAELQFKNDDSGNTAGFILRKKTADQGKILFPGLDIEAITGALLTLGLLIQHEEGRLPSNVVPDETKLAAFKKLPDMERFEYLAGGIALFLHRNGLPAPYQRGLLRNIVELIHKLCNAAKNGRIFPEVTLVKLTELFRRQEESNWAFLGELPSAAILLRSLVMAGLFTVAAINEVNYYCMVFSEPNVSLTPEKKPFIAMDSSFSFILYPEISFSDAMDLAAFSALEETGTTVRFVFSRDSVVRGFDCSYSAEFLWQMLERLSGDRVPDALKWNLNDWEKRWQEVSLNQGVVLMLSSEKNYLAQTEPLASMIKRNLAPGIYLLSAGTDEAAAALRSAGIDIVARPKSRTESKAESNTFPSFFSPLEKTESEKTKSEKAEPSAAVCFSVREPPETEFTSGAEQQKERFRLLLSQMKLSGQEQEELKSRIERRMVVSEIQLKDVSVRYEKLEARSLDYVGKTGIVKQAIASGSLLELSCLNGEKILGSPESLEKKGNEMILVLKPKDGGELVKLALGKISLIRRIKQSIFGV